MEKGPLAAFPMVNIKVTLNEGRYHDVDSSDLAYQLAARLRHAPGCCKGKSGTAGTSHES